MTINDKARLILLAVKDMREADAIEYIRAMMLQAHVDGMACGVEQARHAISQCGQLEIGEWPSSMMAAE